MKKINKIISALIIGVLMLSSCTGNGGETKNTTAGSSEDITELETLELDGFEFGLLDDGTYSLINYSGDAETLSVPAEVDSVKLTEIGVCAFKDTKSLKSITVPEGVVRILNGAFLGCDALEKIIFPSTVTEISKSAVDSTLWYKNQPDGFVSVNSVLVSYKGSDVPDELQIPNGIEYVSAESFAGTSVKAVDIPESVRCIGESAFANCATLGTVTGGEGILNMGAEAFEGTAWLQTQKGFACISSVLVKSSVKNRIADIPKGVKVIASGAFTGSRNLIINVPEGVEIICDYAFSSAQITTKISIPASVRELTSLAFSFCPELAYIEVAEGNKHFSAKEGILLNFDATELICYPQGKGYVDAILPEGIVTLRKGSFAAEIETKSFVFPESLRRIESGAFDSAEITKLTINRNLEVIESGAFLNCISLEKIEFLGTAEQWENVTVFTEGNDELLAAEIIFDEKTEDVTMTVAQ